MSFRCKDPAKVAQGGVLSSPSPRSPRLSCIDEPLTYDLSYWADPDLFWYYALHLKDAVYYAACFFILSDALFRVKYILHCHVKNALAIFVATFIIWFVLLTVINPDCGVHQSQRELGSKFLNSLEFSFSVLFIGVGIYSALSLANYISNSMRQSLLTFTVGVAVMYVLIMCFGDPEGLNKSEWERTGNPIPLFKDLK